MQPSNGQCAFQPYAPKPSNPAGKRTSVSAAQLRNALRPTVRSVDGSVTDASAAAPWNTSVSRSVSPSGTANPRRAVPLRQLSPRWGRGARSTRFVSDVQLQKAWNGRFVTPAGSSTDVTAGLKPKANVSIDVTGRPPSVAGTTRSPA